MRVVFWDEQDPETVLWEGDLPLVPRLEEIVKLPSGVVYQVYAVKWQLMKAPAFVEVALEVL